MGRSKIDTVSADLRKRRGRQRPPDSPESSCPFEVWVHSTTSASLCTSPTGSLTAYIHLSCSPSCYPFPYTPACTSCVEPNFSFNLTNSAGTYMSIDMNNSLVTGGVVAANYAPYFSGTPALYTFNNPSGNLAYGGPISGMFSNLLPGIYTLTVTSYSCLDYSSGGSGPWPSTVTTNTPYTFNITVPVMQGAPCVYTPELSVCFITQDPAALNTPIGFFGGSNMTYGQWFALPGGGPVGTVAFSCTLGNFPANPNSSFIVDGNPLSPADIGKSFDAWPHGPNSSNPLPAYTSNFSGIYYYTITNVCASSNQNPSLVGVNHISEPCPLSCDPVAWNAIPYAYKIDWPHDSSIFYNPPITLPSQLIAQGYTSPSAGGTGFPSGYHMQNLNANLDYPNQSTICEWCTDWSNAGSIPNTIDNRVLNWGWTQAQAEALCSCCPAIDPGYINYPIPPTGTLMW